MLKEFSDIAPKAAIAAVVCWGGLNYFVIGPEAATRIVRADHLPRCEAQIGELAQINAKARIADVPKPATSRSQDMASQQLERMQGGMLGEFLNDPALEAMFGFGSMVDIAIADVEYAKQAAVDAYDQAVTKIKEDTARTIEGASDLCTCASNAAISETRNEWTMLTASLGLFRPEAIKLFEKRLRQVLEQGACAGGNAE